MTSIHTQDDFLLAYPITAPLISLAPTAFYTWLSQCKLGTEFDRILQSFDSVSPTIFTSDLRSRYTKTNLRWMLLKWNIARADGVEYVLQNQDEAVDEMLSEYDDSDVQIGSRADKEARARVLAKEAFPTSEVTEAHVRVSTPPTRAFSSSPAFEFPMSPVQ